MKAKRKPKRRDTIGLKNAEGKLVLSTSITLPTAECFLSCFYNHDDGRTLRHYASDLYEWRAGRYVAVDDGSIRPKLLAWLTECADDQGNPFPANPTTVRAALESIAMTDAHVDARTTVPSWIGQCRDLPPAVECLPMQNGIFHIPTRKMLRATPRLFATHGVDFKYDPNAPSPVEWLKFLDDVFDGDSERIQLLQEWAGYCLTPDTRQHKIMMMFGPPRSGKGTIATILKELIGPQNVCHPTTSSLVSEFGLASLLGASLAVIGDARFAGPGITSVTERLLTISGEDPIDVNQKYKPAVSVRLSTRFMFLSNELPRLTDASTALAKRFLLLPMNKSAYGREDLELKPRLRREMSGIFNWALAGWASLNERGYFIPAKAAEESARSMEDLASPVGAWLREWYEVGTGFRTDTGEAFASWCTWCEKNGIEKPGDKPSLGRNLRSVNPAFIRREGTNSPFYVGFRLRGSHTDADDKF